MVRGLLVIGPALLAGLLGAGVTLAVREADPAFEFRQRNPSRIEPSELANLIARAKEPVARPGRVAGTRATCRSRGTGDLKNPWICRVRYPNGHRMRFRVELGLRGDYRGINDRGDGIVSGCCVTVGRSG